MYRCYGIIEELAKSNGSGGILRVKDRFNPVHMDFGYRDMLINIKCKGSHIIAEVQLHHDLFYRYKAASHNMYKKGTFVFVIFIALFSVFCLLIHTARLFEVNKVNLAYIYARKNLRNVVGDKVYAIDDEKKETEDDPWELLDQWKLDQYGEMLIEQEGYDIVAEWKGISEQELRNMEADDGWGNKIKWKNAHIKRFMKNSAEL